MVSRKSFLKNTSLACLGLAGIAGLSSCATVAVLDATVTDKKITVPLAQMMDKQVLKLRAKGLQYDVLLIKKTDGSFYSLLMKCTHNDASVLFDGTNFQCPLHGSTFNKTGKVTNGPATLPMLSLETILVNDIITIKIV